MIGAVMVDTFPFSADKAVLTGTASIARKSVIGGIRPGEFTGDEGRKLSISGTILPSKIGGLTELNWLNSMRANGDVVPVTRGDGVVLGLYAIKSVTETHKHLLDDGVGFEVEHQIVLDEMPPELPTPKQLIGQLLSLFDLR
ncbi:phage tail protein [Polycladidibacter hongkongensis]|uniref:phage tail protein n=1 Tax=Polycladidibacter hongkongensis TaxID=1647556 RepID=UPI000836B473|nr:phage tail protein [Pseudovibrio hongkongensis]